jgi:hypothetical protein
MKCDLCGQEFVTTHACQGAVRAASEPRNSSAKDFALFHYLGEAWRIVVWDDAAVRRAKDDPRALSYGIVIWLLANAISNLVPVYLWGKKPRTATPEEDLLSLAVVLLCLVVLGLVQIGIVHLIAKYFCAGEGSFIQILRPLLLASFVFMLQALPLFGGLLTGIAWISVTVMVFYEVDGMPYLTAFLVSGVTGLGLEILVGGLLKVR